ncbi:hypothetical protein Scep_002987 [Stephania cephalantha]|uniref:Non-specific serine/threonine protein kinase n=1 Tax=Stephania cephalantha TaxID=152367 RepID=A0AAP0LB88_9MAGN
MLFLSTMMNAPLVLLLVFFYTTTIFLTSSYGTLAQSSLSKGSSLSVEKPNDVLVSSNGVFTAGFYNVGDNAYYFAIWFTQSSNSTIVWMANRDQPVNGRGSILLLSRNGNLVLKDIGRIDVWTTVTNSATQVELTLLDTGNLVLQTSENDILWESFNFPTDTLLPYQPLTRHTKLISSRSRSNYSSGMYSLFFDNDNLLHLLYDGPETSSLYWPSPAILFPVGRTTYNSSRIAFINLSGYFKSSDAFKFYASDYGEGPKRRLTIDYDGNLRLYSLDEKQGEWIVSWQAIHQMCKVHGICGVNSLCVHGIHGKRCSCLPGFKEKHSTDHDWSYGCQPKFNHSYQFGSYSDFVELPYVDFYGFDMKAPQAMSLEDCKRSCLRLDSCKAVMYQKQKGMCYPKSVLFNGIRTPSFVGTTYLRLPNEILKSYYYEPDWIVSSTQMNCSTVISHTIARDYPKDRGNRFFMYLLWFVSALGGVEMVCIVLGCCFLYRTRGDANLVQQGHLFVLTGSKKFTYRELQKATSGFSNEIGRGGGGTVYKGVLPDGRVAAIKRSDQPRQYHTLVTLVREKMSTSSTDDDDHDMASIVEQVMDPRVDSPYSVAKMEVLVKVALQCVEEEKDARPTMRKVVEMLIDHHENV